MLNSEVDENYFPSKCIKAVLNSKNILLSRVCVMEDRMRHYQQKETFRVAAAVRALARGAE
jgi:hypothetical protein